MLRIACFRFVRFVGRVSMWIGMHHEAGSSYGLGFALERRERAFKCLCYGVLNRSDRAPSKTPLKFLSGDQSESSRSPWRFSQHKY